MHLPNDSRFLLQIEPTRAASGRPLVDDYTRAMASLLNGAKNGSGWRGWHTCKCGANSGCCDLVLSDGSTTNSLAVHYLAKHRAEVPQAQLARVLALAGDARAEPTEAQIEGMRL